ncbi:MAG: Nif11-like leader peptide family natural product precursor [Prochlorococcus sp.]|nr:Nif11-like leader peptide family natural product precursor [Prochlorococcus sp.]
MLGAVDSSSAALADAQQDSQLEAFVAFAKQDSAVKEEIKMATNEVDVIRIAQENGFSFDSRAILRQWSKVTDFSRPTWFGWFAE